MRNWLVAGGLAALAGVAQGADVEIFGIHTPAVGKWAVDARLTNVGDGPERMEKLTKLLDVVSKQTGLKLELARRKVPVWVIVEVKPEA